MANPEHMEMQQNIKNYRTMAGVEDLQLVDRDAKPHLVSFGDPVLTMRSLVLLTFNGLKANSYERISHIDSQRPIQYHFYTFRVPKMKYHNSGLKNWKKKKINLENQYDMVKIKMWRKCL